MLTSTLNCHLASWTCVVIIPQYSMKNWILKQLKGRNTFCKLQLYNQAHYLTRSQKPLSCPLDKQWCFSTCRPCKLISKMCKFQIPWLCPEMSARSKRACVVVLGHWPQSPHAVPLPIFDERGLQCRTCLLSRSCPSQRADSKFLHPAALHTILPWF